MNKLTREHEDRLLIEYRLISTNKKIDYWLNVENWKKEIDNWLVDRIFTFHHDWLIDFQNTKDRQLSRFVDLKMLYVNFSFNSRKFVLLFRDFSRENFRFVDLKMFYVNFSFNSRKFVLWFRDFFKEFELNVKWTTFIVFKEKFFSLTQIHNHFRWFTMRIMKVKYIHRFQRKNFKLTIFFWLAYFYEWWNFFLIIRFLYEQLTIFFNYSRIFTNIFDDCILFIRVSRRAIHYLSKQNVWSSVN